ncbi:NAD-dependent epimerase/dehydratase family protein [Halobacillus kuroshimensis]|uniref:NAD-dependent epimerase/dehydratase family protein n=1 Tax=Halobacillus kuroshimensis TaxID=302481 RepID=UPI0004080BF5|nr:NAD-dependent epimerase/dehydratase family protein [Halobacillus kuroshimensis]
MKKILITGSTSYIGENVVKWLEDSQGEYVTQTISVRDDYWKRRDFSKYDVVLHLAGIAHVSADPRMKEKYYQINRDLTIEVAKKAKDEGVSQFIFMSSIIVYGDVQRNTVIDRDTVPNPSDYYGDSKLQAEKSIVTLSNSAFNIAVIRPPMIYGRGSKGNYPRLARLAKKTPIFPNINNQRSMLHIDSLCEFIRLIIENKEEGLYFPQNSEYVNTSELVLEISKLHGRKVHLTKLFNPLIRFSCNKSKLCNKLFGDLVYDKNMSFYSSEYRIRNFKESLKLTENT